MYSFMSSFTHCSHVFLIDLQRYQKLVSVTRMRQLKIPSTEKPKNSLIQRNGRSWMVIVPVEVVFRSAVDTRIVTEIVPEPTIEHGRATVVVHIVSGEYRTVVVGKQITSVPAEPLDTEPEQFGCIRYHKTIVLCPEPAPVASLKVQVNAAVVADGERMEAVQTDPETIVPVRESVSEVLPVPTEECHVRTIQVNLLHKYRTNLCRISHIQNNNRRILNVAVLERTFIDVWWSSIAQFKDTKSIFGPICYHYITLYRLPYRRQWICDEIRMGSTICFQNRGRSRNKATQIEHAIETGHGVISIFKLNLVYDNNNNDIDN